MLNVQIGEVKMYSENSQGLASLESTPSRFRFGFRCVDSSSGERIGLEVKEMERNISLLSFTHMLVF